MGGGQEIIIFWQMSPHAYVAHCHLIESMKQ